LTGAELLHPDFEQLKADGTEPEHVILYKLLSLFGPAPPELLALIDDEYWTELLTALSEVVIEEDPGTRFAQWQQGQLPNIDHRTKDLILKMTNLSPLKRATIDEILNDPWWK
jgi:serine/threonine protein kinase